MRKLEKVRESLMPGVELGAAVAGFVPEPHFLVCSSCLMPVGILEKSQYCHGHSLGSFLGIPRNYQDLLGFSRIYQDSLGVQTPNNPLFSS